MKTFTVRISRLNQTDRFIPNCTIYRDKVVMIRKKGVGEPHEVGGMTAGGDGDSWDEYDEYVDVYKAFVNSQLLPINGIDVDECRKLLEADDNNAFTDERIFKSLVVMGENYGGLVVTNYDIEQSNKEQEILKNEYENFHNGTLPIVFESGIFGYKLQCRLPDDIWKIIKPYATYHKGDDDDEELAEDLGYYSNGNDFDIKGWFYTDNAMQALIDNGFKVKYESFEVESIEEMPDIFSKISERGKAFDKAYEMYNSEMNELIKIFTGFYQNGELVSESECDEIRKLPITLFKNIKVCGQNIYGGGSWFHVTESALYIVENNGGDGDNWSLNNYGTGGAGAICMKVQMSDDVKAFLIRANEFELKNINDFYHE